MKRSTPLALLSLLLALGLSVPPILAQPNAWINEMHYDNDGGDTGEFVEIVIENSGDFTLSDFSVVPYNGNDGASYSAAAGTDFDASSTSGDFTIYAYNIDGLQNGAPDGLALCYQDNPVSSGGQTQFLSYEGTFTASGGCADGITSTDIGVQEHGDEPIGQSVQLEGDGTSYAAFAWASPKADSPGQVNAAQTLGSEPSGPAVQFTSMGTTVSEDDGTVTLTVSISNPNGSSSSAEIAFDTENSSADGADLDDYSAQSITFPAGASEGDTESVTVYLTDDSDTEGSEVAAFVLQNPTNASVGSPSSYELTIQDDDLPDLAINEFLADPNGGDAPDPDLNGDGSSDSEDEFVEILNAGTTPVEVSGFTLTDEADNTYTFPEGITIDPGEGATIIGSGELQGTDIGGFTDSGVPSLNNGGDTIYLNDADGRLIQSVAYGSSGSIAVAEGVSSARNPNGSGAFELQSAFGPGGDETAGRHNNDGSALPVELAAFTAQADGRTAVLTWTTASETGNARFDIQRQSGGTWRTLATREGAGTTPHAQHYQYRAPDLPPGIHLFRLRQVDFDGTMSFSDTAEVSIAPQKAVHLSSAHPNPFRQATRFQLTLRKRKPVTVAVFNALGQRVRTLHSGPMTTKMFTIQADDLPSGLYILRAAGPSFSIHRRVTLLR